MLVHKAKDGGEDVLVELNEDGQWEVCRKGHGDQVGLWRDAPKQVEVKRSGLMGFLGFKQTEEQAPDLKIDPSEVRTLQHLGGSLEGKARYRDVELPAAVETKAWKAKHYNVSMSFDENGQVESRTEIQAQALKEGSGIKLDLANFPSSLDVTDKDGTSLAFNKSADGLAVVTDLSKGNDFSLNVAYSGKPEAHSHPAVPADLGWLVDDGSVVTFNGVDKASSWLPGDDSPSNKATYSFQLDVPKGHFAVANGRLAEVTTLGNGGKRFRYDSRFPMASYLASVNVFDEKKFKQTTVSDGFDVVHPRGMEQKVRKDFENHPKMMNFLENRLGPYPFDTYGAIVKDLPADSQTTRYSDGNSEYIADSKVELAFEAQTRPIFPADSIQGKQDFEGTIIHELAHQWFGNAVTKASEQDLWVNEAFPTYSGYLWNEEKWGTEAFDGYMTEVHKNLQNHNFTDTMGKPDRDKLFSQENYERMHLSMHSLRKKIGDEQFFKTLKNVVDTHKHTSITSVQMADTMNKFNGGKLGDFFDQWLHSKQVPPLEDGQPQKATDQLHQEPSDGNSLLTEQTVSQGWNTL